MDTETKKVQSANLHRVRENLFAPVVEFCKTRVGASFHMKDLVAFCERHVPGTAPDSPSRILRLLRGEGKLSYTVVNRRRSEYLVTECN
jgi:hypothetical protein